jgi:sugar phosphate isomerase/epimerase
MASFRPILISTVQYHEPLSARQMTQAEVVTVARELGVDGVELRADYWQAQERELPAVRDLVRRLGLLVTYATTATLFGADAEAQRRLQQDIDDAAALGAALLRVFPGPAPGPDDQPGWERARAALRYAAARGVRLALENFARAPGCRVAEIKATLDRLDVPALGTNVDIGNYAINGEDLPAAVRTLGPRIVSTHLRDQVETPAGVDTTYLGGGSLPLREVLAELARLPQPVIHCFEFTGGDDPAGRIQQSLAYLRAQ